MNRRCFKQMFEGLPATEKTIFSHGLKKKSTHRIKTKKPLILGKLDNPTLFQATASARPEQCKDVST